MEVYYREDWDEIKDAKINRPEGFKVIEIIENKLCTEWKGEKIGKYAVFLMTKKNVEHFQAMHELSKLLQRKVHSIGIKDTNAITQQLVYIITNGEEPTVKEYTHNNIEIKFLGFSNKKFQHNGNMFIINIETVEKDEVKRRLKELSKDPFLPAFIGYQRFGTIRPTTHLVGKMLLERRWCEALNFILSFPYLSESDIMKRFRKLVSESRYEEALEILPSRFKQERTLLKNYLKYNDCFKALKTSTIPLKFYAEAYQSYLFNKYLSRKIDNLRNIEEKDEKILILPTYFNDCDEICKEIYIEEGIEKDYFNLKILKIKLLPIKRKAFMKIRNISYDDEKIEFSLDRGMYATVVIRELIKGDPRRFT